MLGHHTGEMNLETKKIGCPLNIQTSRMFFSNHPRLYFTLQVDFHVLFVFVCFRCNNYLHISDIVSKLKSDRFQYLNAQF